jgi:hypothetical protein
MSQTGNGQSQQDVGKTVDIQNDGAAVISAETVSIQEGGAFIIKGKDVRIREGGGAVIIGETVNVQEGGGGFLVAKQAELKDSTVLLLAAKSVSGEFRVLVDLKAAVLLGLVAGLVVGVLNYFLSRD